MRILHVIDSIDPAQGGPSSVIQRLASAQAALGHDVIVAGQRHAERAELVDDFIARVPGIDAVDIRRIDRPAGRLGSVSTRRFTSVFHDVEPDVVHLHGVWDPPLVAVAGACRKLGTPYLIRPAGMLDAWTLAQKSFKKRLALRFIHGPMLRHAAAIHALNTHEKQRIALMELEVPIAVIGNGVFLSDIEAPVQPGLFRASVEGLDDRPFVLFLSRLHHKKGLDLLAEAWARIAGEFPEHRLVIAGRRDDDSMEECLRRLERAGLSETVFEVGEVYGDRKAAAFRECDCFVLPSRQEGFSVAVTEALGFGAPVVITEECHFPEVDEETAGIVTSLEIPDVARGLQRMLSDREHAKTCAANGARMVRERYTWPIIASKIIDVYEEFGGIPHKGGDG